MKDQEKINEEESPGAPICSKCGNVMIFESLEGLSGDLLDSKKKSAEGEWVCPHCQGEIDFLGGDDE